MGRLDDLDVWLVEDVNKTKETLLMRRALSGLALALSLVLPGVAHARADLGLTVAAQPPSDSVFTTFNTNAPTSYQRIGVTWDQFGTYDGSRCVAPTQIGPEAKIVTDAVSAAEHGGQAPFLVVGADVWGATNGYQWPPGAQVGPTPNDIDYQCGMAMLSQTLAADGLARPAMPVELFNEPDNTSFYIAPAQAARFLGDLVSVAGYYFHPVVGAFQSAWDDSYSSAYAAAIKADGYNVAATSWSVHDYNDPVASVDCRTNNLPACHHDSASKFVSWLQGQNEPTSDVWIAEVGDASYQGWLVHSRYEEARTAYSVQLLRDYAQHVIWYQWLTFPGDGWDSALVAPSGARPSYCVLAFGETPAQATADSRCPGS